MRRDMEANQELAPGARPGDTTKSSDLARLRALEICDLGRPGSKFWIESSSPDRLSD